MNRPQESTARRRIGKTVRRAPYRPVDGIVVGDTRKRGKTRDVWVLLSRPGEGVMEFFLDDEPTGVVADPRPQCCLGVEPDGTLTIGRLDWDRDSFLSEMIYEARMGEVTSE